eukprot:g5131.t1
MAPTDNVNAKEVTDNADEVFHDAQDEPQADDFHDVLLEDESDGVAGPNSDDVESDHGDNVHTPSADDSLVGHDLKEKLKKMDSEFQQDEPSQAESETKMLEERVRAAMESRNYYWKSRWFSGAVAEPRVGLANVAMHMFIDLS